MTNDGDGNINFGNITFTKAGTYKIKATEIVPEDATENEDGTYTLNHVTYDTHVVETTFTVTDQNGKLTVNRAGTTGSTTFTNTYEPDETTTTDDISVDTNILVTKEVTGAPATETTPQTCTDCGYVITPATGHVCASHLTKVEAKPASCTEDGNIAYYECSCGQTEAEVISTDKLIKEIEYTQRMAAEAEANEYGDMPYFVQSWSTDEEFGNEVDKKIGRLLGYAC